MKISNSVMRSVDQWLMDDSLREPELVHEYGRYLTRKLVLIAACLIMIFVVAGYAMTIGGYDIDILETYSILWQNLIGNGGETTEEYVIIDVRLPRIAMGIIAGSGLAAAGVVMQSTLRNPLADPYTTGVSSGALFGATLAFTAQSAVVANQFTVVLDAFVFSLIPTAAIIMVAKVKGASPTVMIMAGIAVMYIFNAMTTVMKLWADPNSLSEIYQWQVGSLTLVEWSDIPFIAVTVLIGITILQFLSGKINMLSLDDDSAKSMGLNVETMRVICLLVVALITATVVSYTGLIGFVGLVAPHMIRILIGSDNRYLLPASAAFGALLLLVADLVGRTVIAPATLQVGVVTAFMGGPLFLWLIMNRKSRVWS